MLDARCRASSQSGGALVLDLETSTRPTTSTVHAGGRSLGWLILPDGRVVDTNTP